MTTEKKIRVLVVDDSALARRAISEALKQDPELLIVGGAVDPYEAREKILELAPDVITLDLEMPRMDGLTFLKKIMTERPTPVIICSSLTEAGAAVTLDALSAGAISIITKPAVGIKSFLQQSANELIQEIRGAANAKLRNLLPANQPAGFVPAPKRSADAMLSPLPSGSNSKPQSGSLPWAPQPEAPRRWSIC